MITLYRMWKLHQLKTKWELAIWQFIDKQVKELIKHPEEFEKKLIAEIAKLIHESNKLNESGKEIFDMVNQKINS